MKQWVLIRVELIDRELAGVLIALVAEDDVLFDAGRADQVLPGGVPAERDVIQFVTGLSLALPHAHTEAAGHWRTARVHDLGAIVVPRHVARVDNVTWVDLTAVGQVGRDRGDKLDLPEPDDAVRLELAGAREAGRLKGEGRLPICASGIPLTSNTRQDARAAGAASSEQTTSPAVSATRRMRMLMSLASTREPATTGVNIAPRDCRGLCARCRRAAMRGV
jgi:hypothetical protein